MGTTCTPILQLSETESSLTTKVCCREVFSEVEASTKKVPQLQPLTQ